MVVLNVESGQKNNNNNNPVNIGNNKIYNTTTDSNNKTEEFVPNYFAARQKTRSFTNFSIQAAFKSLRGNKKRATPPTAIKLLNNRQIGEGDVENGFHNKKNSTNTLLISKQAYNNNNSTNTTTSTIFDKIFNNHTTTTTTDQTNTTIYNSSKCKAKSNKQNRKLESTIFKEPKTVAKNVSKPNSNVNSNDPNNRVVRNSAEPRLNFWVNRNDSTTLRTKDSIKLAEVDNSNTNSDASKIKNHFMSPANIIIKRKESLTNHDKNGVSKNEIPIVNNFADIKHGLNTIDTPKHCDKDMLMKLRQEKLKAEKRQLEDLLHALGVTLTSNESSMELLHPAMITDAFHENHDDIEKTKNELGGEKDKSESKSCPNTPESARADFSNLRHQSAKNPAFFQSLRERVDRKQPYNKLGHNSPIYSTLKELRPSLGVDGFSLNNTETNTNPPVQITFNVYKNEYGATPLQQTPQNKVEKKNEKIYDLNHYLGNVTENDIYSECIKHQAPILAPHNMIKTNGSLPRQRKFGCVMHHPNNNNNKILLTENKVDNSFERDYYLENSNGVDENGLSRPSNTKTSFVESFISNDTLMSSNLKNSPDKNNNNNYITFKNYYGKNNQLTTSQLNNSIDPGKYINNSNSNTNKNNEAYDVDTKGTSHQTNPKNDLESTPSPENGNSNGNNQQIKIVLALKHKSLQLQALEERTLHQIMLEKTAYEKEQNVEMQALLTKQREIEEYKKVGQAYLESLERQRDEKIQHLTRLKGNISKVKKRLSLVDETGTDDSNTAECQKSQSSKASMDIEEMQNSSIDQQYEELEFLIVEMDSKIEEEKERIKRKITAQAARYSEKCQYVKEKLCNPKTSYIETINRLEQHVQFLRDEHKRIDMLLEVESQKLINGHNTIHNGEKSLEENQSFFSATTDSALGVSNKELQTSSPQGIDKSEGVNSIGESRSNTESLDSALKDSSESLRKRASQEIQTFWKNLTLASSSHIHSVNGIDKSKLVSKTLTNMSPESDVETFAAQNVLEQPTNINVCSEDKIEANKVLYEEVTYSQIHKSSTGIQGNDQPFAKETKEKSCHAAKTDSKTKKQSSDLIDKKLITNNYASIDVITNASSPENTAEMNRKKLAQYEQTLKILESNENGAQLTDREFSSFSSFPSSLNLSSSNKHSSSPPLNPHHDPKLAQKSDSIKNNVLQKSNDCEHNLISNSNNSSKLMSIPCGHIQCCPASEEIPRLSENYQNNYNYNDILRQMSRNKEYTLHNQNDMPNPMGQSFISHQSKLSQTNSTLPDTQGKQNFIDNNNNQNIGNKSEYPYYCYLNKNNVSMVATPCYDRYSFVKHKTDLNSINSTLKNDMVNRSIYHSTMNNTENNKINYYYARRPNLNNCNNTNRTMISNLNAEGQYHRYEGYYDQIVYDVLRNSAGNNLNGHTAHGNNTVTDHSNNYQTPLNQTQTFANNNNMVNNNLREYVYGRVCISPLSTTTTNGEKIFQATMNGNKSKKGKNGTSFRHKKTETIIQSLEALGIGNTERYVCLSKTCARGFLHKLNTSFKSWQKRWFVFDMLKQRVTYYLDKTETKAKEIIYFQSIHEAYRDYCSGPSFKPPVLAGFFALKTQERLFYLCAPTKECADLWIEVFNSVLNLVASEYHLK